MFRTYSYLLLFLPLLLVSCQSTDRSVGEPSLDQETDQILAVFPELELRDSTSGSNIEQNDSTHFIDHIYYHKGKNAPFTGSMVNKTWNDTLKAKGFFEEGRIQRFVSWYPNGNMNSEMIVTPDSTDAKYITTTWHHSGTLKSKYNRHSGKRYFESGTLKSKWNKNRAFDFWENGNPKAIWPLEKDGEISFYHGEFTAWNPNNTISTKGIFKDGRKHGKWVYRDSTGSIEKIIIYKNGKADSTISPTQQ
ncbi:toxin-antitoxin system YwqK family antitoxin [Fodinibius saliphilus]|uniref:toxin-antitoxin system YwqK family antitoxin n=1 Tax=Fodinibius saliphilus TaxID=1920650 RepID=UPI00110839D3|nr:hypothetical protein [Fodinibius saliphilus]